MKTIITFIVFGLLCSGCAREAQIADLEHGIASQDAFDRQIAYPDARYAGQGVEGLPGIHAEPILKTYHKTFEQGFTKEDIDITEIGLGENQ